MKKLKPITLGILAFCAIAIIGWDIILATNQVEGDTISEMTLAFARRQPAFPFGFGIILGFICGHLFWPQQKRSPPA